METSWTVTKDERRQVLRGLWRGFLLSGSAAIMPVVLVVICLFVASWRGGSSVVNVVIAVIVIAFAGRLLRRGDGHGACQQAPEGRLPALPRTRRGARPDGPLSWYASEVCAVCYALPHEDSRVAGPA